MFVLYKQTHGSYNMPLGTAINCNKRAGSAPNLGEKLSFYKFPDISKVPEGEYQATRAL